MKDDLLKGYVQVRSARAPVHVKKEPPVVTLNEKIGKVINEIKLLNLEKARKFGIEAFERRFQDQGIIRRPSLKELAARTERDELSTLFELTMAKRNL